MKSQTSFPLIYKGALILAALIMTLSTLGLAAVRPAYAQGSYEDCTLLYAVQEDETLDDISQRFDVDEQDLLDLNPFLGNNIFPGLVLCISTQGDVVIPPTGAQPGITVVDVDPSDTVTVQGVDFPGNTLFTVQMLDYEATDPQIFRIGTFTTPQTGRFQQSFPIPAGLQNAERIRIRLVSGATGLSASDVFLNTQQGGQPPAACTQFYTVRRGDTLSEIALRFDTTVAELVELNNIPDRGVIFSGQRLCVSTSDVVLPPTGGNPALEVLDVSQDQDVTLRVRNLPAGAQCELHLGAPGGQFARVRTFNAPQDGVYTSTFSLPQGLQDQRDLAARVICLGQGITLNAQFTNPNVGGGGPAPDGNPALDVVDLDEDNSVTLRIRNIPTGTQCEVQLGAPGAQFARAGTFTAPQDGSYVRTFALPQGLRDERNLAARVICPNEDITLTTEFTNVNVGGGGGGQAPGGNPVLDVLGVDQNDDVTLRVRNLPAGADCEVQLGAPGAQFARVGTFTAPQDGTFIRTFDLPQGLLDERNLAARVVCPDENISLTTEFQN